MEGMEGLKDKDILITGGTGFIGSHLAQELINHGAHVIIPYIEIEPKSILVLNSLSKKVTLVPLDITHEEKVSLFMKKTKIDYIFHLAAQTLVTTAYENPQDTLNTNIMV